MSRAEDALMRLYESASVRDELTDEEAEALLKWAETEVTRLDQSGVDDETFDDGVRTLMKLAKEMNRFAGGQEQGFSAQDVDETPQTIAGLANELDHPTDAGQITAAGTGDPMSTVEALTALLSDQDSSAEAAAADSESSAEVSELTQTEQAEPIPHDLLPIDQPTDSFEPTDDMPLSPSGDDVEANNN